MNEHLWKGADIKLEFASVYLLRMIEALNPPRSTVLHNNIENDLERRLLPNFYAFVPAARSVSYIVNCCFGKDDQHKEMKAWFKGRNHAEQTQRKLFTKEFKPHMDRFDSLTLSKSRVDLEHRAGHVEVTGPFNSFGGAMLQQSPAILLTQPDVQHDAAKIDWLGLRPVPHPLWEQFKFGNENLFVLCQSYLQDARDLVNRGREIALVVHSSIGLTSPPNVGSFLAP